MGGSKQNYQGFQRIKNRHHITYGFTTSPNAYMCDVNSGVQQEFAERSRREEDIGPCTVSQQLNMMTGHEGISRAPVYWLSIARIIRMMSEASVVSAGRMVLRIYFDDGAVVGGGI